MRTGPCASLPYGKFPFSTGEAPQQDRAIGLSKLHHGPADNFSRSKQVDIFVDLAEREHLEGVADLVLRNKRHDLAQVGVVAAERAMKSLFARNPREQWDVDAVAHEPHIDIVAADRQQTESQLHHLRGARAVDDSVEVTLARGLTELLRNICRRLALDADNGIGPVFLGDVEIVDIAVESDNRSTTPKELSVLDGIPA